ncbi:type VII secretion integral membrane protein EccD [Actinomadura algeriensis]|uniref:Type VII secretion integral membrane protein EccD n=1 Tax=Actinomadura algeriensis TaxID=1679523 RepID=A0ABR9JNG5_9ACTN|nr:type VII secretion integral membrane protein EccD [Actinomadura algeriensis]MBE1532090.1 type VII secretion integral membrane protein EccD [Actinomadura algeriensis]
MTEPPERPEPSADGYRRVTVAGPRRRTDLLLPGGVPVAALLPRLMALCVPDRDGDEPAAWRLTRLDGRPVPPGGSLDAAGVADGEVLTLHPRAVRVPPPEVEDVRGAVEDRVDEGTWLWGPRATFGFAIVLAAAGPLAVAVRAGWATTWDLPAGTAAGRAACAFAAALLAVLAAWSCGGRPVLARIVLGAGCLWGALAAGLAAAAATVPAAPAVTALAATGALAVAALAWAREPAALPFAAGSAVAVAAAGVVSAGGLLGEPAHGLRTAAVLLVLAAGALPRAAMTLGGLAGADQRAREHGRVPAGQVEARLHATEGILVGALAGTGGAAAAAIVLLTTGGFRDQVLAGVVSLALVLRSRLFDRGAHVLCLRVAGVAGLGAAGFAAAADTAGGRLADWSPGLALAVAAVIAGLSAVPLPRVPRARLRRVLDWTELLVIVAMVAAAAAAYGTFDGLGDLSP